MFIIGMLMSLTLTGCGNNGNGNIVYLPEDPTVTPAPTAVPTPTPPPETVKLESIMIDPVTSTQLIGGTQTYQVTAILSNGDKSDVTAKATYSSSDSAVATTDTNGIAHAVGAGTATITASYTLEGIVSEATATLTVLAQTTTINSLVIDPAVSTQLIGATQAYQVTALVSTGDKIDATAKVTYTSSNTAVAVIGADGVAHTVGEGTATITASYNLDGTISTATAALTVLPPATTIDSLVIDPVTSTQLIGGTQTYQVTALLSTGDKVYASTKVTYTSSDDKIAVVSKDGVAHAIGEGTATITASYNLNGTVSTATAKLTVTPVATTIDSLVIDPLTSTQPIGATQAYEVTAFLSTGDKINVTDAVVYTSSDSTIAVIGTDGVATGLAVGTADIKASYTLNGVPTSVFAEFTVTHLEVVSIEITPADTSVPLGATGYYTSTATLTDGQVIDFTLNTTWVSADPSVVSLSMSDGNTKLLAQSNGVGTTTITGSWKNGESDTATVEVTAAVLESITVSPANKTMAAGFDVQYTAEGFYSDDSHHELTGVTWTSGNTDAASITQAGLATTHANGDTKITADFGGQTATTNLTVTNATVTSLVITPASAEVITGLTGTFTATAMLSDNRSVDVTKNTTWTSDKPTILKITNVGTATAVASGTAIVTAKYDSFTEQATVEVIAAQLQSITVTPDTTSVPAGMDVIYTAVGHFDNGLSQPIDGRDIIWLSSNKDAATIDVKEGVATTYAPGTTTISANGYGVVGEATLTVTHATVVSIEISPADASVPLGATGYYTSTATLTDGQVIDFTVNTTWESADTSVVSLSFADGHTTMLAQSNSVGSTTITGSFKGVTSNTATVEVTAAVWDHSYLSPATSTIVVKSGFQRYDLKEVYSDGSEHIVPIAQYALRSDNADITIDDKAGEFYFAYGYEIGTAIIHAHYYRGEFTANLTVTAAQ